MTEKLTNATLAEKVADAWEQVPYGSEWRHRNGTLYTVTNVVMIEATCGVGVAYQATHYGYLNPVIWVRPLSEFLDGRFARVEDEA